MFWSSYDHLQKARHDEKTTITLIIVHQVETEFYMKILIKLMVELRVVKILNI
jgi:hypothetical protein